MKRNKFLNNTTDSNEDIYNFEKGISGEKEDTIKNDENTPHSEYSDHIYVAESESKEQLYDRNNPLVKLILFILGSIALIGTLYYIFEAVGIIK